MRVITRHLTSQIILSTSLVLMALIGLFLFFDLVNQVDKIGSSYGMLQALAITGFSIPSHLYEVMPIGVLLGAVYTMSRWAANSEFTILRVAGMSPLSLTRSLMVPGLILVGFTYLLGEFVGAGERRSPSGSSAEDLQPAAHRVWLRLRRLGTRSGV